MNNNYWAECGKDSNDAFDKTFDTREEAVKYVDKLYQHGGYGYVYWRNEFRLWQCIYHTPENHIVDAATQTGMYDRL